ncbi:mitochondrial sodium/calcium exchanger protein isoform X1 [Monodelphis domestica]|uniref:mitochondrial sodium/calcium exchanger protein isoform X1 n=1 Tax=Monodelphis domestica TaxID=13616 RepID=UPI0024E1FAEC|nr:mitochondrial sodium/calcium exchanger protein isoform X1 [Monodelphis domestica]XP_056677680.1 mitochondrial sodium/calcium exchanger protein isoform X1 [Monodelphis domestica]XP_056677681.1 mitochondrial sodium/calcium exchanger protein isoform X1 [Monodelphis domestica]
MNITAVRDCREVSSLNDSLKCHFILTNPDCQIDGGYFDYLRAIFCLFPQNLLPLVVTLYMFWVLYLFLILAVTAEKFFCPNLSAISTTLKLSHNVAGVTFLAFGNGAPDVFSAIIAFSNSRTASLAIGALFGAGVLVTTVVAGGIAIIRPFTAASRPFFRDIIFYMVSVFLTFTVLYRGRINLAWSLGYLGFYIFYVSTVLLCTWIYKRLSVAPGTHSLLDFPELQVDSEDGNSSVFNSYDYGEEYRSPLYYEETTLHIFIRALNPLDYHKWKRKPWHWKLLKIFKMPVEFVLLLTVPTVDLDKNDQNWKRPLNCLHLFTGPLFCVLTLHSGVYGFYEIKGLFPIWGIIVLLGTLFASITFFATSNDQPPRFHQSFAFLGFFVSALWINVAATEVVNILHTVGIIFQISDTVLGLTLLAWGNSIGDVFSDLTLARQGYPRMAFSACFGGIIFNMLIGVGLGSVLEISRNHMEMKLESNELLTWILAGALGLSLLFTFISVPVQCFQLSRVYGFCLIFFYLNFLVVALLTEFGVIHL